MKVPFLEGIKNFKEIKFPEYRDKFLELIEKGQSPQALFITCSDSRIHPDEITGADIGDLFIVRNIGNMVPPYKPDDDYHGTAAAIEYAVSVLKVPHIIVCGHSYCGACESLYKDLGDSEDLIHVRRWLEIDREVREIALKQIPELGRDLYELTERLNIIKQLENLLTYPAVNRRVKEGDLTLHGWYYRIDQGEIEIYNFENNEFYPISMLTKK
ncbi:carbonic anhydrase [Persephonella sp.]